MEDQNPKPRIAASAMKTGAAGGGERGRPYVDSQTQDDEKTNESRTMVCDVDTKKVTDNSSGESSSDSEEMPEGYGEEESDKSEDADLDSTIRYLEDAENPELGSGEGEKTDMETLDMTSMEQIKGKQQLWSTTSLVDLESETPQRVRTWSFDSTSMKRRRTESADEEQELEDADNEQAKKVKKGIENIMNLIKTLKRNEEQNTKREIKGAIQKLERQADIFNRKETKEWIQGLGEKRAKSRGKEVKEMSTQTETEEERGERLQEIMMEREINEAATFQQWKIVAEKNWKERYYRKTRIKEGNPLWQQEIETRVVVVEPDDDDMTRSLQNQFKRAYPVLAELKERYEEVELTTKTKIRGIERERKEKVIKLIIEKSDISVWKMMQELKERNEGETKIAIHHLRQMPLSKYRKMLEIVFRDTDIQIDIYTTQAKIEEEKDRNIQNERRTFAIIVERPGKTYEETIRGIKQRLQGKKEANKIEGIRSTRDGKVLITTQKDKEAVMEIQKVLRDEDGQKVTDRGIKERKQTKTIYIRGLMITTEKDEIIQAINRDTGCEKNNIKMSTLRPYAESMMAVTVEMEEDKAKKLTSNKRIRIGLAMCSVEERAQIKKCLKCWSPQHLIRDCTGPDRRNCCYNCGLEGHLTKECANPTRCPNCEKEGHRAASMGCEMYRSQIKEGKRVKRNRQVKEGGEESAQQQSERVGRIEEKNNVELSKAGSQEKFKGEESKSPW
nr:uncharacterized protein LOC111429365 [Onthophagus taurus]